jgi:hypothetical protein
MIAEGNIVVNAASGVRLAAIRIGEKPAGRRGQSTIG